MRGMSQRPYKRASTSFVRILWLLIHDSCRSGGMYMAEVLEAVCQKRKLSNPKDYALVLDHGSMKVYIPLDRTVKSLQGGKDKGAEL